MMNYLENFLTNGLIEFGSILDKKKCKYIYDEIVKSRDFSPNLFRTKEEIIKDPDQKNTNPGKGISNFAESFDLSFIEENPILRKNVESIIGEDYEILLKNFVIAVPENWIPEWLKNFTNKSLAPNLGPYIKKNFRDITYLRGVDFHMDLIDRPNFVGENIILYIYLNDVKSEMSPLNLIEKSHNLGATRFPHHLRNNSNGSIEYSSNGKDFEKFNKKTLIGGVGTTYLWSSFTLHGTKPLKGDHARVSLKYDIRVNPKNNNKDIPIRKFLKNIKGNLSMPIVRDDIDFSTPERKQIKFNKVLK